ncbi:MAG: isoleucine--tRNA ligase [Bdellovibrionota bacterium]
MYQDVVSKVSFPENEKEVLEKWKKDLTFEKSLKLSKKEHIFYDGPPFPTGNPHHGTIFVSILKDSIARFFTMEGYTVPRRWGWDCHGLPIENAIEKKLGITKKAEIEDKIGVAAFNNACREFVSSANDAWETYIDKIGRWTEYRNAYRTMDVDFMESVLWVFSECYKKGLIYKDYRVTPYCYQCETSLSISDTRESDSTRPRQDPTVVVKFKSDEKLIGKDTYFLAWTTTPWTLTSNLALAVGEDIGYVAIESGDEVLILAENAIPRYQKELGEDPKIIEKIQGKDLVGKTYEPIFPYYFSHKANGNFRVLSAEFVTTDDGVGIVHIAPAFGEDDYWACKRAGIAVQNPVDLAGNFTKEVKDFVGRNVHEANKDIIKYLKTKDVVLNQATLEHNYPHCWRCRTPLIYRAMDAWYFAVEKIKDKLVALNQDINWVPEHVKEGRFGKWLDGARDWNISRSRFWGTPIPVWECQNDGCDNREVLGSLDAIAKFTGTRPADLHKEFLDPLLGSCSKCSGEMKRVDEVLDCWFESGSMPYGQCHYPFENKEWFDKHFPSDFIVEYPGQIRCWFYYLHVLSTAIFDRPAFKNCIVHGTLLAADGTKISKSKKNYTDPMELIDRYGADAMRIYLLSSPAAAMNDLNFKDSGIESQIKNVLLPLWNAYSFFVTYAKIDNFIGDEAHIPTPANQLDQWILAKLFETEREVHKAFSTYHLNKTLNPVLAFLENFTNWYIRRSRERFWVEGMDTEKIEAYETLFYVLISMIKMLAPSAPFVTEVMYQNLSSGESVHLTEWPRVPDRFCNENLTNEVELTRQITSLGLSLRQKIKIKVKQPLSKLLVALPLDVAEDCLSGQIDVLKSELNVKEIVFIKDASELATLRAVPNAKVLGPKYGKEMQFIIKAARDGKIKENGDKIIIFGNDKSWEIDRSDITIGYEGKSGVDVVSNNGILVALDTKLTAALIEEGIANEINRKIQSMRKDAGYRISDRIYLHLEGELDVKWKEMIFESALAEKRDIDKENADIEHLCTISDRKFIVRVRRD